MASLISYGIIVAIFASISSAIFRSIKKRNWLLFSVLIPRKAEIEPTVYSARKKNLIVSLTLFSILAAFFCFVCIGMFLSGLFYVPNDSYWTYPFGYLIGILYGFVPIKEEELKKTWMNQFEKTIMPVAE